MGLFSWGAYFRRDLLLEGILHFNAKWAGLGNKNSLKHEDNSLKQLKTANTNSPWAYTWESLLSEGYLYLRFWEFIFRRAYFWRGLLSEFYRILDLPLLSQMLIQITLTHLTRKENDCTQAAPTVQAV